MPKTCTRPGSHPALQLRGERAGLNLDDGEAEGDGADDDLVPLDLLRERLRTALRHTISRGGKG